MSSDKKKRKLSEKLYLILTSQHAVILCVMCNEIRLKKISIVPAYNEIKIYNFNSVYGSGFLLFDS